MNDLLNGRTILVVDDEALLAHDTADALQHHGCRVDGPHFTLASALASIRGGNRPDAAVLDIQIGTDLVWPLADELAARGIPFLFASAYCRVSRLPESFADRLCLAKPVRMTELVEQVANLCAPSDQQAKANF